MGTTLLVKIKTSIRLMRPKHWIKNMFIFFALIFSRNLFNLDAVGASITAFIAFSFAASFVYIINDMKDIEKDRAHPRKKNRPLASGEIKSGLAIIIAFINIFIAIGLSYLININTMIIVIAYILINILYSFKIKHIVILDVIFIAIGFVLRVMAGAIAINVEVTSWILLTSFCISLFLGFGKRRNELVLLQKIQDNYRPVLDSYDFKLLDNMITSSASLTILTYGLYTIDKSVIERFNTDKLIFTVPFVIYGVYKYMHILYKGNAGDPVEVVTKDPYIIINVLLWGISVIAIVYG